MKLREEKNRKRDEAKERNAAWQALTPKQQLAELDKRPGASARQRERITRRAKEQSAK